MKKTFKLSTTQNKDMSFYLSQIIIILKQKVHKTTLFIKCIDAVFSGSKLQFF